METRISKHTQSVCPRYAFALVRASYCFFKGLRLMAVTVAAKIDKNSLIPNKWAAETRCRVGNGFLQRSAVPTGAPVHPNLSRRPTFSHYRRWRSRVHANCSLSLWDIHRGWLAEAAMHGWVKTVRFCCWLCFILGRSGSYEEEPQRQVFFLPLTEYLTRLMLF